MPSKCINAVKTGIVRIVVTDDRFPKNPSFWRMPISSFLSATEGGRQLIRYYLRVVGKLRKKKLALLPMTTVLMFSKDSQGIIFTMDR